MIGTSLVLLWSMNLSVFTSYAEYNLPILSQNYRPTEIIVCGDGGSYNPTNFYLEIGENQWTPSNLIANFYLPAIGWHSCITTPITTLGDLYIPAKTQEYLEIAGGQNTVTIDIVGYQVPAS